MIRSDPGFVDAGPGTNCRLGTKCRLQTGHKTQTENKAVFRLIGDMSSENIPSVTQSLFRGHLSPTFALLWNIPYSATLFTCVGGLWRTRYITIVAILIQWDANKWPGILKFSLARFFIYFVFNKAARPQVIYLLLTWFASWLADLRKAAFLASECEDSGRATINDARVLCHLSSISYCVLLFLNIDMTACAQSEKIWVDYEGLKFYVRKTQT